MNCYKWSNVTCFYSYVFVQERGHVVIRVKTGYSLLMWWLLTQHETWWLRMSSIDRQVQMCMKFSAITKIHNYKRLHEGHHFIPMAMEVHNTPRHFIKECVCLFHDRR
jgi:hypothetical protein